MASQKKVVILGGGFAGLVTARHLVKAGAVGSLCEVTVIDMAPAHLYTPWLYEVATGVLRGVTARAKKAILESAVFPYNSLPGFHGVRFVQSAVDGLDTQAKQVRVSGKRFIPYDILVVSLGAEPNYFGIQGLPENALTLKRALDAEKIHDKIVAMLDKASADKPQTILIAGAGPNGMEFVSELANTIKVFERRGKIPTGSIKITLVDPTPELFTILPKPLQAKTVSRFKKLGVDLRPGLRVSEVGKDFVKAFKGDGKSETAERLTADLVIWSAGVKVTEEVETFPFPRDPRGRITVENTFAVPGFEGVFAAGDCAAMINPHTGKPDPQSAQVAHYQSHALADNLLRYIKGDSLKAAVLPARWAFLVAIGGPKAAGVLSGINVFGYPAFLLRRLADLRYFWKLFPPFHALKTWLNGVSLYRKNDGEWL